MSNLRRRLLLDSPQYNKSEFEFTFDKVPSEVSGDKSYVHSIKGNSLVWNQLLSPINVSQTVNNVTATSFNGKVTLVVGAGGVADKTYIKAGDNFTFLANHKYILRLHPDAALAPYMSFQGVYWYHKSGDFITATSIKSFTSDTSGFVRLYYGTDLPEGTYTITLCFHDLTQMFGAGNEPTTVEEFEKWYSLPYYGYNVGEIFSNKTESVKVIGFNQWDEEWERGAYNTTTGNKNDDSAAVAGYIRSKNPICVLPSTDYYITKPAGKACRVLQYDGSNNYIDYEAPLTPGTGQIISTHSNTVYIKFHIAETGNYQSNVCINISDASRNGQYEPYKTNTISLNLPTMTGKLLDAQGQPTGSSVVINPEGMAGQGDWADYCIVEGGYITKIVKNTPRVAVDLGNMEWITSHSEHRFYALLAGSKGPSSLSEVANICCARYPAIPVSRVLAGDYGIGLSNGQYVSVTDIGYESASSADFKTAMAGVKLIYQLATPEIYLLDTPIPLTNRVDNGGTKRRLPEDTASSVSAPFACDIAYDTINTNTNSIERVNASEEFIYDNISIDKPVKRGVLTKIKGKSLVWNQLVKADFSSSQSNGVTFSADTVNKFVELSGELVDSWASTSKLLQPLVVSHKYYYHHKLITNPNSLSFSIGLLNQNGGGSSNAEHSAILTASSTGQSFGVYNATSGDDFTGVKIQFNLIDLTLMFGSDNEPSTVAEFEKLYPLSYYNYNAGEIINNTTSALEITGTNWKNTLNLNITSLTGKLNGEGSSVTIVPTGLKSAGTVYDYGVIEKGKLTKIVKCIREVDMGTLTWAFENETNRVFRATGRPKVGPNNLICSKYALSERIYGTAYMEDKSIMAHNTDKMWYVRDTDYDSTSGFTSAMNGVLLYYELDTPEVYILDNPVPVSLLTYKDCTVKQLPENTSTVVTAPNVEVIKNQIH